MRGIARTHRFGIGDEEARVSVRGEARVDPVLVPVTTPTSDVDAVCLYRMPVTEVRADARGAR
jgi:hypothetical protein